MKEGGSSLNKTFREYNLVFKGLREKVWVRVRVRAGASECITWFLFCFLLQNVVKTLSSLVG